MASALPTQETHVIAVARVSRRRLRTGSDDQTVGSRYCRGCAWCQGLNPCRIWTVVLHESARYLRRVARRS